MNMCGLGDDTIRKKVLIVDDHSIVRRGLTELLGQQPDLCVCAAVGSGEEALETAATQPVDLAVVDISMGQMDGIELTNELKRRYPEMIVLILSMHDESVYGDRARRAGAAGFVAKHDGGSALLKAIAQVLRGQSHYHTNE